MMHIEEIEKLRDQVRKADGSLVLMQQNPANYYHWSKSVCESPKADWLYVIDLAIAAAKLRGQLTGETQ